MYGIAHLPGFVEPDEFEGRLEWVRPGEGLVPSLTARLGSEVDAAKILLAALPPLRAFLAADTWAAIVEELPWDLRNMLRTPELHVGPVPRLEQPDDYVRFVAHHTQHPDERAALNVSSVLGALKETVPAGLADAIGRELPPTLAPAWAAAR